MICGVLKATWHVVSGVGFPLIQLSHHLNIIIHFLIKYLINGCLAKHLKEDFCPFSPSDYDHAALDSFLAFSFFCELEQTDLFLSDTYSTYKHVIKYISICLIYIYQKIYMISKTYGESI